MSQFPLTYQGFALDPNRMTNPVEHWLCFLALSFLTLIPTDLKGTTRNGKGLEQGWSASSNVVTEPPKKKIMGRQGPLRLFRVLFLVVSVAPVKIPRFFFLFTKGSDSLKNSTNQKKI